jgi:hypothetical protein
VNPKKTQWNVVQMSEHRGRKNPNQVGRAKPQGRENYRPYADEAMALGNSWREEK